MRTVALLCLALFGCASATTEPTGWECEQLVALDTLGMSADSTSLYLIAIEECR
jgi:hypothetical protein